MVDPKYVVALEKPCVYFDPEFLPDDTAETYYQDLLKNIKWEKTSKINRWVSLHHCTDLADYQYRDAPGAAHLGFTPIITSIQKAARATTENYPWSRTIDRFEKLLKNAHDN